MKVVTLVVLDDGSELRLEAQDADFIGLQCQHCLTMYELGGALSTEQAHEVTRLYGEHVETCRMRMSSKHLPGHA